MDSVSHFFDFYANCVFHYCGVEWFDFYVTGILVGVCTLRGAGVFLGVRSRRRGAPEEVLVLHGWCLGWRGGQLLAF